MLTLNINWLKAKSAQKRLNTLLVWFLKGWNKGFPGQKKATYLWLTIDKKLSGKTKAVCSLSIQKTECRGQTPNHWRSALCTCKEIEWAQGVFFTNNRVLCSFETDWFKNQDLICFLAGPSVECMKMLVRNLVEKVFYEFQVKAVFYYWPNFV